MEKSKKIQQAEELFVGRKGGRPGTINYGAISEDDLYKKLATAYKRGTDPKYRLAAEMRRISSEGWQGYNSRMYGGPGRRGNVGKKSSIQIAADMVRTTRAKNIGKRFVQKLKNLRGIRDDDDVSLMKELFIRDNQGNLFISPQYSGENDLGLISEIDKGLESIEKNGFNEGNVIALMAIKGVLEDRLSVQNLLRQSRHEEYFEDPMNPLEYSILQADRNKLGSPTNYDNEKVNKTEIPLFLEKRSDSEKEIGKIIKEIEDIRLLGTEDYLRSYDLRGASAIDDGTEISRQQLEEEMRGGKKEFVGDDIKQVGGEKEEKLSHLHHIARKIFYIRHNREEITGANGRKITLPSISETYSEMIKKLNNNKQSKDYLKKFFYETDGSEKMFGDFFVGDSVTGGNEDKFVKIDHKDKSFHVQKNVHDYVVGLRKNNPKAKLSEEEVGKILDIQNVIASESQLRRIFTGVISPQPSPRRVRQIDPMTAPLSHLFPFDEENFGIYLRDIFKGTERLAITKNARTLEEKSPETRRSNRMFGIEALDNALDNIILHGINMSEAHKQNEYIDYVTERISSGDLPSGGSPEEGFPDLSKWLESGVKGGPTTYNEGRDAITYAPGALSSEQGIHQILSRTFPKIKYRDNPIAALFDVSGRPEFIPRVIEGLEGGLNGLLKEINLVNSSSSRTDENRGGLAYGWVEGSGMTRKIEEPEKGKVIDSQPKKMLYSAQRVLEESRARAKNHKRIPTTGIFRERKKHGEDSTIGLFEAKAFLPHIPKVLRGPLGLSGASAPFGHIVHVSLLGLPEEEGSISLLLEDRLKKIIEIKKRIPKSLQGVSLPVSPAVTSSKVERPAVSAQQNRGRGARGKKKTEPPPETTGEVRTGEEGADFGSGTKENEEASVDIEDIEEKRRLLEDFNDDVSSALLRYKTGEGSYLSRIISDNPAMNTVSSSVGRPTVASSSRISSVPAPSWASEGYLDSIIRKINTNKNF